MDERLILVTNDDGYASKGNRRGHRRRAALRPGGGRGARDGAERHGARPLPCTGRSFLRRIPAGEGGGDVCVFGYARRLREGGFRPPAARPPRGSGALGREPRLELGRQCHSTRGRWAPPSRAASTRLSVDRAVARGPRRRCRLRGGGALCRTHRACGARTSGGGVAVPECPISPWDGPRRYAACASAARTSATGAREFYRREDPQGREYFWLTGDFVDREPEAPDTDERALAEGTCRWCRCRSISPITPAWIPLRATLGLE